MSQKDWIQFFVEVTDKRRKISHNDVATPGPDNSQYDGATPADDVTDHGQSDSASNSQIDSASNSQIDSASNSQIDSASNSQIDSASNQNETPKTRARG